jgi:hypothetical protein
MFRITARKEHSVWTVHRVSRFTVPDEMLALPAALGVTVALKAEREAASRLAQPPVRIGSAGAADLPQFAATLNRAIQQAGSEGREVVRPAVLRSSLDARFREFSKSVALRFPTRNAVVAAYRDWISDALRRLGPHGQQRAFDLSLAAARVARETAQTAVPALQVQLAEAEKQLNEGVARADEAITAFHGTMDSLPPPAGIWTRHNLSRIAPYLLWMCISAVLVLLFLPGWSWPMQLAAATSIFIPIALAYSLIKKNDLREKARYSELSLIREAQSQTRRLATPLKNYYDIAERLLLASKELQLASQVVQSLETMAPDIERSRIALETLEKAAYGRLEQVPVRAFNEASPTLVEIAGQALAETILRKRSADRDAAGLASRLLMLYETLYKQPFADAIAALDPDTLQSRLEEIIRNEIGSVTVNDVVDAAVELEGGSVFTRYIHMLAGAARNVYGFRSVLSGDHHCGRFTVALPRGCSPRLKEFFERAFTRPPVFQTSFDQDLEIWWTALELTNEDSMLHERGLEFAARFEAETRNELWHFPRRLTPAVAIAAVAAGSPKPSFVVAPEDVLAVAK